ncbi:MAG: tRNA pseudouridine(55) synthase TruB [Myxococcota bacterium]
MGRRGKRPAPFHGVVVVDKAQGPTSHDVVARVRRALNTGAVGHAGTLDPMATGVLVVAIGQGTKLVPWLTAADKSYEARLRLGAATDTEDAEGQVVERRPVPALHAEAVRAAATSFLGAHRQRVPAVSAVRVDGRRLHERVRAGEEVTPPERDVVLHEVSAWVEDAETLGLRLRAAKGFYVRAFGRDLARRLGTVGHLVSLRRLRSGVFDLAGAVPAAELGAEGAGERLLAAHLPLVPAAERAVGGVEVTAADAADAAQGRRVALGEGGRSLPVGTERALIHEGRLLAIARREDDAFRVVRGFPPAS